MSSSTALKTQTLITESLVNTTSLLPWLRNRSARAPATVTMSRINGQPQESSDTMGLVFYKLMVADEIGRTHPHNSTGFRTILWWTRVHGMKIWPSNGFAALRLIIIKHNHPEPIATEQLHECGLIPDTRVSKPAKCDTKNHKCLVNFANRFRQAA